MSCEDMLITLSESNLRRIIAFAMGRSDASSNLWAGGMLELRIENILDEAVADAKGCLK